MESLRLKSGSYEPTIDLTHSSPDSLKGNLARQCFGRTVQEDNISDQQKKILGKRCRDSNVIDLTDSDSEDEFSSPVKTKKVCAAETEPLCKICWGKSEELNEVLFTECNHTFHNECLAEWTLHQLNYLSIPNCPICLAEISNGKLESLALIRPEIAKQHQTFQIIEQHHSGTSKEDREQVLQAYLRNDLFFYGDHVKPSLQGYDETEDYVKSLPQESGKMVDLQKIGIQSIMKLALSSIAKGFSGVIL